MEQWNAPRLRRHDSRHDEQHSGRLRRVRIAVDVHHTDGNPLKAICHAADHADTPAKVTRYESRFGDHDRAARNARMHGRVQGQSDQTNQRAAAAHDSRPHRCLRRQPCRRPGETFHVSGRITDEQGGPMIDTPVTMGTGWQAGSACRLRGPIRQELTGSHLPPIHGPRQAGAARQGGNYYRRLRLVLPHRDGNGTGDWRENFRLHRIRRFSPGDPSWSRSRAMRATVSGGCIARVDARDYGACRWQPDP